MVTNNFLQDFNAHSSYLKGFAMKLTRDKSTADDLFQETALRAFKNQNKFQPQTNIKAWLSTIMKNSFINSYRKNKRQGVIQDYSKDDYLLNSSERVINNEGEMNVNINELTSIIDRLEDHYRIPFLMTYQGYQYDEIQKALGDIPLGTIKSRIFHARKILRKKISVLYN